MNKSILCVITIIPCSNIVASSRYIHNNGIFPSLLKVNCFERKTTNQPSFGTFLPQVEASVPFCSGTSFIVILSLPPWNEKTRYLIKSMRHPNAWEVGKEYSFWRCPRVHLWFLIRHCLLLKCTDEIRWRQSWVLDIHFEIEKLGAGPNLSFPVCVEKFVEARICGFRPI